MENKLTIIKASGEKVPFSEDKYRSSLHKSGASDAQINAILKELKPQFYTGISTHEIYNKTHELMQKKKMFFSGGRYRLRQAMLELGPTGFPFERFVARLMEAKGFKTLIDQTVDGKCIRHEIDIIATKGNERLLVECKYHNWPGERCDIKTTLYVKARHDDIAGHVRGSIYDQCYLITNTKFSSDSINYATCIGMHLLGWAYPHGNGLERIIDELGLHPITCLSTLPKKIAHALAQQGIIVCHELAQNSSPLNQLGLNKEDLGTIVQECRALCGKEC
jgi:hypothetical protein